MNRLQATKAYQQINISSEAQTATPHRLIGMLLEGVLKRLAEAKGAIDRSDTAAKGASIGKAISIIGELQGSLRDIETNEVAGNLDRLYDYMSRTLLQANLESSNDKLNEVAQLIIEIKAGWDAIGTLQAGTAEPA
ncbi:flagellar export chaperone FliS [Marinobacterium sedimentorum]|uniref:flagellar export chaperone FliS n=1 Tax=Marinobacterium sedimentorum TaxID=2927804 RepID=UPI0020C6CEC3|nr:flagellar export chaperone FliS [Marinobacterium sedimentorum]MCP8687549.1 flagellar export chaperone FliS [Marinobacterium sedimentorum]